MSELESMTTDRENAISIMSPSWQHAASKEPDLMTRYVTMAENQFKKKNEEIARLSAIATKHATRADELYETLEMCIEALESSYDATEWPADGSSQQEVTAAICREALNRTKINAVSSSNDD